MKWRTMYLANARGEGASAPMCPVCFVLVAPGYQEDHLREAHPEHHEAEQTKRAQERHKQQPTEGDRFVKEAMEQDDQPFYMPERYRCSKCQQGGVRLWREATMIRTGLHCAPCLGVTNQDQIRNRQIVFESRNWVPAVLATEKDIYWSYLSIPPHLLAVWDGLYIKQPEATKEMDAT